MSELLLGDGIRILSIFHRLLELSPELTISSVDYAADGRSWDISNLWICDGSLFPTTGAVNPSLTIQALALRAGDRIEALARGGEL